MDWQQIASLTIVGLAVVLLGRYEVKKHQRTKLRACGHDCECSSGTLDSIKNAAVPTFIEPK